MRDNGPVTGREVTYDKSEELVSATDSKGRITFANDVFCRVAKFERDELIGKAHNIVRHPEMPAAAYAGMWTRLQAGEPWMGLVKNRCKDGDHYWVHTYVTPLKDRDGITGYESVRVRPRPECVPRAEAAYRRINAGKPFMPGWQRWCRQTAPFLAVSGVLLPAALAAGLTLAGPAPGVFAGALLLAIFGGGVAEGWTRHAQRHLLERARGVIDDPLAAYIYTGKVGADGAIELAMIAQRARLRTALGRMVESAREVRQHSDDAARVVRASHQGMENQMQETAQVAESMRQMSQAVQEVAGGAAQSSQSTSDTLQQVDSGSQVLGKASASIESLSARVLELAQVVERLSTDSQQIAGVVDVIGGIAEQTNLLALNAAIEAARAGEQGRGFAVVADEVRTLASRTQESTRHIQKIIEDLGDATRAASQGMGACEEMANTSVAEMADVNAALQAITDSVREIDAMTGRIAVAAEEQSAVASEIESNTRSITDISTEVREQAKAADRHSQQVADLTDAQLKLVERFN